MTEPNQEDSFQAQYSAFFAGLTHFLSSNLPLEERLEQGLQVASNELGAIEQKYKGFTITMYPVGGKWRFVLNGDYVDGFNSQEEAFDDACNRIDAIVDSLE